MRRPQPLGYFVASGMCHPPGVARRITESRSFRGSSRAFPRRQRRRGCPVLECGAREVGVAPSTSFARARVAELAAPNSTRLPPSVAGRLRAEIVGSCDPLLQEWAPAAFGGGDESRRRTELPHQSGRRPTQNHHDRERRRRQKADGCPFRDLSLRAMGRPAERSRTGRSAKRRSVVVAARSAWHHVQ